MSFFSNKQKRNGRCKDKDTIIENLLSSLDIKSPSNFYAILMPNLYGMEIYYLLNQGIPNRNLFAIERNIEVHNKYRNPQYEHLADITTTRIPTGISGAIDLCHYHRKKWNLIYLDFLSRITADQVESLLKINKLEMLAKNGMLILTFGKTRAHKYSLELEKCMAESGCDLVVELINLPHQTFHYESHAGNNKKIKYKTYVFRK